MKLNTQIRILIRAYAVVNLAFACICLIMVLIAFLLAVGPLKYFESLLIGVIYQLIIWAILQASLGSFLLLVNKPLARFIMKTIPDDEAHG